MIYSLKLCLIALSDYFCAMEFLNDLWKFMKERKKFWLAPVIIVLLILGILIVFAGGSAVAPFIYTLF